MDYEQMGRQMIDNIAKEMAQEQSTSNKRLYTGIAGVGVIGGALIGSGQSEEHPLLGGIAGGAIGYGISSIAASIATSKKL